MKHLTDFDAAVEQLFAGLPKMTEHLEPGGVN
jgi:hypothetical protein